MPKKRYSYAFTRPISEKTIYQYVVKIYHKSISNVDLSKVIAYSEFAQYLKRNSLSLEYIYTYLLNEVAKPEVLIKARAKAKKRNLNVDIDIDLSGFRQSLNKKNKIVAKNKTTTNSIVYKAEHKNKTAADNHAKRIRKRGGKVKRSQSGSIYKLEYSFPKK